MNRHINPPLQSHSNMAMLDSRWTGPNGFTYTSDLMVLSSGELLGILNDPDDELKRLGLTEPEKLTLWPAITAARCLLRQRLAEGIPRTKSLTQAIRSLERLALRYLELPGPAIDRKTEIADAVAKRIESLPDGIYSRLYGWKGWTRSNTAGIWMREILAFCREWREGHALHLPTTDGDADADLRRFRERLLGRSLSAAAPTRMTRRVKQLITEIQAGVPPLLATTRFRQCQYPGCWRFVAGRTRDVYCSTCRRLPKPTRWRHARGKVKRSRKGDSFALPVVNSVEDFNELSTVEGLQWLMNGGNLTRLKGFRPK